MKSMLCEETTIETLKSNQYLWERKNDGCRSFLIFKDNKVKLMNRHGNDITNEFPELAIQVLPFECVLDGEIVVESREDKFNTPSTSVRINRTNSSDIKMVSMLFPATFIAFDIVEQKGEILLEKPLEERKKILHLLEKVAPKLKISEVFDDGNVAWGKAMIGGWEGIVGKRKGSKYEQKRSSAWLKLKRWQEKDCKVIGFTTEHRDVSAFILENNGKVNCSLNQLEYVSLLSELPRLITHEDNGITYIKPSLVAKVRFLSENNGQMRFPTLRELVRE